MVSKGDYRRNDKVVRFLKGLLFLRKVILFNFYFFLMEKRMKRSAPVKSSLSDKR